jgi:hypothetical protein
MSFSEELLKYGEYLSDITYNDTNVRVRIIEYDDCIFQHEMKDGETIRIVQLDR